MKLLKYIFRTIVLISGIFLLYILIVIFVNTIADYKPTNNFNILRENDIILNDTVSFLSWNIGYAGMGQYVDFFYDGGKTVVPDYNYYKECLDSICYTLSLYDRLCDIILLQEVDFNSKRSYYENQKKIIDRIMVRKKNSDSLINYQVPFISFPLLKPLGKVCAGLLTLSNYKPVLSLKIFFDKTYSWPKQIFFLDRGILIHAYRTKKSKFLFVINIHLSAFDDAKEARIKELNVLKLIITRILQNNHYLIIAGDWNINPPNYKFCNQNKLKHFYTELNNFHLENANFYYDSIVPTNRKANMPYIKNITPVTTLDYVLFSNNVKLINYKAIDLEFKFSDHNPIFFTVALK